MNHPERYPRPGAALREPPVRPADAGRHGDPGLAAAAPDPGPTVLRDCAEAEAYVASVCFKHGPPRLTGIELEWLLADDAAPGAPVDPAVLATALGPHAPTSLVPDSPALPLPGGSAVTVEPGGQVELASPPLPTLAGLVGTVAADQQHLFTLLARHGLRPLARAADPERPPVRVLDLPRYAAMEQAFDRHGAQGRSAMCSTAAVQVCVDAGRPQEVAARWAALHAVGPVLLAAFANSPRMGGRDTGWKSARWLSWQRADPVRTRPPVEADFVDPAEAWARRVLESPVLCVRRPDGWLVPELTFAEWVRGGLPTPPTVDDLRYHISTLFPPVRPHGHLEVRYLDAQPGARWALPAAVIVALLADPIVTDKARAACEPTQDRWLQAARHGLADPLLARAAATVFELACAQLPDTGAPPELVAEAVAMTEHQVLRGRCPADDPPSDLVAAPPNAAQPVRAPAPEETS